VTIERNLLVNLSEIKSIVLECNQCKSRMVISPDHVDIRPNSCPRGHGWQWDMTPEREQVGTLSVGFVTSLKNLRAQKSSNSGFTLLLEFKEPE
jgi:hypothetical protein